jgi:hypothetical protein
MAPRYEKHSAAKTVDLVQEQEMSKHIAGSSLALWVMYYRAEALLYLVNCR